MTNSNVYPPDALAGRTDIDVIDRDEAPTLAALFRTRVARSAERIAYREYDPATGHWVGWTWKAVAAEVARWQRVIEAYGLSPGDRLGLRLRTRLSWAVIDQAALGLGLVVVPLYVDDRGENCAYVAEHSGIRLLILERHEQWLEMRGADCELGAIERVILLDEAPPPDADTCVVHAAELLGADAPGALITHPGEPDELATIMYTSGTTGRPKGVMLTHGNLLSNARDSLHSVAVFPTDSALAFLPWSHTLGRTTDCYLAMTGGVEIAFCRSIPDLPEDLRAIRPTMMVAVPRIFERVYQRLTEKLDAGPRYARWLFDRAVSVGTRRFEHQQGRAPWRWSLLLWPLLDRLVASKLRAGFGGRIRLAVSGGAPLPVQVGRVFTALGINVLQGYGLTESSPVITINPIQDNKPDSIGLPIRNVEIRIGEGGELLARGPNIMRGYWRNDEATAAAIDSDGWLHTGDTARIDPDGHVYITGRIKDIIVLANGEKLPPVDMEAAIGEDPLITQVLIVGEGRPYLSAILVLHRDRWTQFARQNGLDADDPNAENAREQLTTRVAARMRAFPGYAQIHQVSATFDEWTIDNGLLTPTLKVKRPKAMERYAAEIEQMYAGH
ncbi:MAG: long-chain fatty acid--CoA ligase [Chromatiales bacterium]|nr:long-chain fatty acid--CoA ligase [Chromatiales bacterium]